MKSSMPGKSCKLGTPSRSTYINQLRNSLSSPEQRSGVVPSKESWRYHNQYTPSRAISAAGVVSLESRFMKEHLKSIIEELSRDANQLEHHGPKAQTNLT